jgi:hypothetical protein
LFVENENRIFTASSRQAFFSSNYDQFADHWFDYGEPPTRTTIAFGQKMVQTDVSLSGRYEAFSLELMDNFTCNRDSCTGGMPVKIYGDYWYCAECTRMPPFNRVCKGPHKCRVEGVRSSHSYEDKYIPLWQRSGVNNLLSRVVNEKRGPGNTETLTPSETIRLLAHYMLIEYRMEFEETGRGDLASMKFKFPITAIIDNTTQAVTHPSAEWPEQHLSPSAALTWEEQTGERDGDGDVLDIRRCLDTGDASTNSISYELCSNDDQANVLKQGVNDAYNKTGSLLVPDGYSLFLPLSALQLRASATLLTWSHGEREAREKHIEYLLNTESHCAKNDVTTALCRVRPEDRHIEFFNPWLGGDWSAARFRCDSLPSLQVRASAGTHRPHDRRSAPTRRVCSGTGTWGRRRATCITPRICAGCLMNWRTAGSLCSRAGPFSTSAHSRRPWASTSHSCTSTAGILRGTICSSRWTRTGP